MIAVAVAVTFAAYSASKWNLANAISTRTDEKEFVDFAVDLAPDDPQTRYAAGVLYQKSLETDDTTRSLAEFEAAAALSPNNYLPWLELRAAFSRAGDTEASLGAIRRAVDLAPNYADVRWAYGNDLIRAGEVESGFENIRRAIDAKPALVAPAVNLAMELFGADAKIVRQLLGENANRAATIALYLARVGRYEEAYASWNSITPELRGDEAFQTQSVELAELFGKQKMYRAALSVYADKRGDRIEIGSIYNGGFETGAKMRYASPYDWIIAPGNEPQIAISNGQKRSGENALLIVFNLTQTAEFRPVSQTVALEGAATYEFEAHYKAELKTLATLRWEILNASTLVGLGATPAFRAQSDWERVSVNFTVPAGLDGILIQLVRTGCTSSSICPATGRVWIDDVSIRRKR